MSKLFRIEKVHLDESIDVSCPACFAMTRNQAAIGEVQCAHCGLRAESEFPENAPERALDKAAIELPHGAAINSQWSGTTITFTGTREIADQLNDFRKTGERVTVRYKGSSLPVVVNEVITGDFGAAGVKIMLNVTTPQANPYKSMFRLAPDKESYHLMVVDAADLAPAAKASEPTNDELNREILQLRDGLSVDVSRPSVRDMYAYPDYIENEDFSAILLDEMRMPVLKGPCTESLNWRCLCTSPVPGNVMIYTEHVGQDPDRKRAVAKAWLAWEKAQ